MDRLYYFIADNREKGPVNENQLVTLYKKETIDLETEVYCDDNIPEWTKLRYIPYLKNLLEPPTPPLVTSRPSAQTPPVVITTSSNTTPSNAQIHKPNIPPSFSLISVIFTVFGVLFLIASGYPQFEKYPVYELRNNLGYGFKTDNAYGATAEASLDTAHALQFLARHQPSDALMKSSLWVLAFLLCYVIVILERIRLAITHKNQ